MRKILFIACTFILCSCTKESEIQKEFNCASIQLKDKVERTDFKKSFKVKIPKHWKTNLYYTEHQSELFAADTTKQLTETYILSTSFKLGNLNFNQSFFNKIDSLIINDKLEKVNAKVIQYKEHQAYWYLANGIKNDFPFHQFELTIKLSENTYFNTRTEIYGSQLIEERICESISIINEIEFLQ